ncbi:MAG: InlB B-repeat-containing protein, partial [Bdellovibrionota bacterium]
SCPGTGCDATFAQNSLVKLTATPDSGFLFIGWAGDCAGVPDTASGTDQPNCDLTMNADHEVTAIFGDSTDLFLLEVSKLGTGTGSVAAKTPSADSINCGSTCTQTFDEPDNVAHLIAKPDAGSNFSGWSGACTGLGACDVAVSHVTQVVAHFEKFSAKQLSVGWRHNCVVLKDASARCWGSDSSGQIGQNKKENALASALVYGLNGGVAEVSEGSEHSCARMLDGSVQCWGANLWKQLGAETPDYDSVVPVPVQGLGGKAIAVAAGGFHSCALLEDGTVRCWGGNDHGQLGTQFSGSMSVAPVTIAGLSGVIAISASQDYSCALISDGSVSCWGAGKGGKLGAPLSGDSPAPVSVTGLTEAATAISAGPWHACALLRSGAVSCWGGNSNAALGSTSPIDFSPTAIPLQNLPGKATSVSAGNAFTCVSLDSGQAYCTGYNGDAQLGIGYPAATGSQVLLGGNNTALQNVLSVSAGSDHACALLGDGSVRCWGAGDVGQLGNRNNQTSYWASDNVMTTY